MARSRIISILVSGVVFAFTALVIVRAISAFEERAFEAGRALLVAGAEHAELELSSGGNALPAIARTFANDEEVISGARALGQLLVRSPPGTPAAARAKPVISRLSKKLNERLTEIRSDERPELSPEFDALTVTDAEGTVLVTDSSSFRTGMRLLAEETDADSDESSDENVGQAGSSPNIDRLLRRAESSPALATLIVGAKSKKDIVWTGAAPLLSRSRLVGFVLVERRLKALPQPSGVSAILVVDDVVQMGQAPVGYSPGGASSEGEPFLLVSKTAASNVPGVGELPIEPLFVSERGVGVWANAFTVSKDAPAAIGYVLTDVTPLFADLGGFQVMVLLLAVFGWLVHVTMIVLSGKRLMTGLSDISDFLGKLHQGTSSETRLNERKLPGSLHRLVRLINKTLEKQPGAVAPIAGAPSLDEVLKAQGEAATTTDLAFTAIDSGGSLSVSGDGSDDLAAVEDFDPFNATGEIRAVAGSNKYIDEDGFEEIEALSDDVVGGGIAPDPTAGSESLPDGADADSALAHLGDDDATLSKPGATVDSGADSGPLAGSAVADLFSHRSTGGGETAHPSNPGGGHEGDSLKSHYRDVFDQFVAAREACGESTEELTFDKFSLKLDKSREAVMSQHECSDVRFSVYVKNGKAALKATPAR